MLISSKLNDILSLIYYDHSVCLTTDFFRPFALLLAGWSKDNSTDALHAWMCVIWYDRFCCRRSFSESSSFLLFIAVTGGVYACAYYVGMRVCVHVLSVCVCARASLSGFACVPSVLQCWRVEARVCLRSEISQISYCLCSFSVHALWFTTPRASYANDAAFSEGFLPELKHAPLVTMMLLGLGDLNKSVSNLRLFCFIKSAVSLRFLNPLTRSH